MKITYRISISSPPDRKDLVAEVFFGDLQWAEIKQENENFEVEFYPRPDGKPWRISYQEAVIALGEAKLRLLGRDMTRAEKLRAASPQLIADVTLYPASEGGRKTTAYPGWGCPCMVSNMPPLVGYDGWPLLEDTPLEPGAKRRLGFVFLSGNEAANVFRKAGRFFLWEGHFIGEAVVID